MARPLYGADRPWAEQLVGADVASDYVPGLRLVIDGGQLGFGAPVFAQTDPAGFQLLGTRSTSRSGNGFLGASATFVSARTTAANPSPLFEIPAGSDWTAQFVIDNISGISGTNYGFFRAGNTYVGSTFIVQSGNDRRPWMRVNGTDVLRPSSGPQWTSGQTLNLVAKFRNASRAEFWWDGRLQHSATHSASQDVLLGTAGIHALLMQNTSEITGGNLVAFRFWTRYLDDAQTQALAQSEHALYEPLRIWVPVSAAGAPSAGSGASAGAATVTATGAAVAAATGTCAASSTAVATGQAPTSAVGAANGAATATATGVATTAGVGAASGVATAAATSSAVGAASGASTGAATAAATGQSTHAAVGSATGVATAAATSAGGSAAAGTSAGEATATAVGRSTHAATGATAGTSTAVAFSAGTSAGSGASTGAATATATGVGLALFAGSSAGAASVAGVGQAVSQATGTSAGAAAATATATVQASAVGAAAGEATALAYSAGITAGVGFCAANAAAAAIGVAMTTPTGDGEATVEVGSELRLMLVPTDFHTMVVASEYNRVTL